MKEDYIVKAKRIVNIIGYYRSGQHAILKWLMAQCPTPTYDTSTNLWHNNGAYGQFKIAQPSELAFVNLEGGYGRCLTSPHPAIFIVRDIKNHVASLKKHATLGHTVEPSGDLWRFWREYAEVALGEGQCNIKTPYMCILFPLWFSSETYRRATTERLGSLLKWDGLVYSEGGRDYVSANGGGSSFDGMNLQGRGTEMKVLERYKSVQMPKIPSHLLELNEKLFGSMYD